MKRLQLGAATLATMVVSATAQADMGIGLKVGTLGGGLEVTAPLMESINGRVGFNAFSYSTTGTESDIDYDVDLTLQTASAILDWYPFKGTFRLSAGYVFNNNSIEMTGKPSAGGQYDLSGTLYTLDSLTGEVEFTSGAYVGMGWGNAGRGKGFGMNLEIGAFYHGAPELTLTATGPGTALADFEKHRAQEEADAQEDLADYKWYPVVSLGMSYTF
ncbi:MAG: hypothetical protein M0R77_04130 [Gammaproteobacteria bacterium]|nr:hypothetical protein [Gammaproteobacteria bacterium]